MSSSVDPRVFARVQRAQHRLDAARGERDRIICDGSAAGLSLRDLARATGLAVETVRRILIEARS